MFRRLQTQDGSEVWDKDAFLSGHLLCNVSHGIKMTPQCNILNCPIPATCVIVIKINELLGTQTEYHDDHERSKLLTFAIAMRVRIISRSRLIKYLTSYQIETLR